MVVGFRLKALSALLGVVSFLAPQYARCETRHLASNEIQDSTAVADDALGSLARLTVSPVNLNGGGKLTLISPERWSALAVEVVSTLKDAHVELTEHFGTIPAFATSIRLTDRNSFRHATGAPEWTNALFYRGQILIPLSISEEPDTENLKRSIRHEYTHAVINALSAGRAPGWLDEGLAQWLEGEENPALRPALFSWLKENDPVPLSLMQGGFTRLAPDMVPAAYAQSLFSATVVINTFGWSGIRKYFDALRDGSEKDEAFEVGFELNLESFERRLNKTLKTWEEGQAARTKDKVAQKRPAVDNS